MGHISFDISPLSDNTWQVELIFLQVSQYCATRAERTSIWNIYNITYPQKYIQILKAVLIFSYCFVLWQKLPGATLWTPQDRRWIQLLIFILVWLWISLIWWNRRVVKTVQQVFQSVIEKVFLCDTSDLGHSLILISEPIFMKRRIFELGEIARH